MSGPPRGIANHNPCNIRVGDQWQGLRPVQTDPAFCQFLTPELGIRAATKILLRYRLAPPNGFRARTVRDVISHWAPSSENNTEAYVAHVAHVVGVAPDQEIDWTQAGVLESLLRGIVIHENGRGPLPGGDWYEGRTYRVGMAAGGVKS